MTFLTRCLGSFVLLLCCGALGAQTLTLDVRGNVPRTPFSEDGRILVEIDAPFTAPFTATVNGVSTGVTYPSQPFVIDGLTAGTYDIVVTDQDNQVGTATGIVIDDPCFTDYDPGTCPQNPSGYFYCSGTGEIIEGGTITVTSANGSPVVISADGSEGFYKFFVDPDLADTYTISYTPPPSFTVDTRRVSATP